MAISDEKSRFLSKSTIFLHFPEFLNKNSLNIYDVFGFQMILSIFKNRDLGVRVCIRT